MTGLWRSIKNEWTKMTSMTKFRLIPILFVGLLIAAAGIGGMTGGVIRLTMANYPYTVLSWLGSFEDAMDSRRVWMRCCQTRTPAWHMRRRPEKLRTAIPPRYLVMRR